MPQAPKMTDLIIEETSGVDHPAHLHEGWLVIKTSNIATEAQVVESLAKHGTVAKHPGHSDQSVHNPHGGGGGGSSEGGGASSSGGASDGGSAERQKVAGEAANFAGDAMMFGESMPSPSTIRGDSRYKENYDFVQDSLKEASVKADDAAVSSKSEQTAREGAQSLRDSATRLQVAADTLADMDWGDGTDATRIWQEVSDAATEVSRRADLYEQSFTKSGSKEAGMSDEQASKGGGYMDEEDMKPKAVEDDLAMAMARIAELESRIQELESAETEAEMPEMPEGEAPTPEMKEALQLAKAAPEPVRKMLEAMVKEKAEAQAALRKEREERADQEAVAKAREDYKHLTMDHEAVGPALRRLALVDAELAKSVETALKAADAQNESADIFTEIGKSGAEVNNSAYQKMVGLAKAAVADGRVQSVQQGIALVATTDPSLYNEYLIEKGA